MFFDEYYLLEYIQSSGTQYIDTGYILSNNSEVDCAVIPTSTSNGCIFGSRTNANANTLIGFVNGTDIVTDRSNYSASGGRIGANYTSGNYYHIVNAKAYRAIYDINGNELARTNVTEADFTCPNNCYIGWISNNRPFEDKLNGKIFYFKIYESGVLVRDYVPAKRKTDNVIGLYDLANNTFYTNAGSGTFTAGHIVDVSVNPIGSGTISIETSGNNTILTANANAGYEFENWTLDGYTQLEYIESSGTQYIDTGILATSDEANFVSKVAFTNFSSRQILSGAYTSGSYGTYFNDVSTSGNATFQNGRAISSPISINANQIYNLDSYISTITSYLQIEQTKVQLTSATLNANVNYYLFASHDITEGGVYGRCKCKLYSAKYYINLTLVRDFIPVIRHSDAQIGLLDLVNLKFYGNSGTGQFIGGNPI